jgi:hypothetical protein
MNAEIAYPLCWDTLCRCAYECTDWRVAVLQFGTVGRGALPGMQVGPGNGLVNNPAVNRVPNIVPGLALNPGMAGAVRPAGMERGGITSALNMGIQNPALQQRAQATANFGLARPVNGLALGTGAPIGPQLGAQITQGGFGMGQNPPARGNPLTMHPGAHDCSQRPKLLVELGHPHWGSIWLGLVAARGSLLFCCI